MTCWLHPDKVARISGNMWPYFPERADAPCATRHGRDAVYCWSGRPQTGVFKRRCTLPAGSHL